MNLDEALAIHCFLQHRPPGGMSDREKIAYNEAWRIICREAELKINWYNELSFRADQQQMRK
jgi:hypothetical protein